MDGYDVEFWTLIYVFKDPQIASLCTAAIYLSVELHTSAPVSSTNVNTLVTVLRSGDNKMIMYDCVDIYNISGHLST